MAEDGVDKEARWLKKGIKTYFGYKKQIAVDSNGLAWVRPRYTRNIFWKPLPTI
ncbi:hypothetical protein [Bergeyella zoohelcum]|uniref:hypothetical protein n=1 Tax=Bergeyella zoohelcum TaxID=1015 RepID=UPI00030CC4A3|nr:hypothetical protein [Bergeyella zoohelcum]